MKNLKKILAFFAIILALNACKRKDIDESAGTMQITISDNQGNIRTISYEKVSVGIQEPQSDNVKDLRFIRITGYQKNNNAEIQTLISFARKKSSTTHHTKLVQNYHFWDDIKTYSISLIRPEATYAATWLDERYADEYNFHILRENEQSMEAEFKAMIVEGRQHSDTTIVTGRLEIDKKAKF
ncbi:MAG: hypothetical protein N2558_05025 [Patescibacteria group bacterium]|jgi:hypothetical protein|uniref:Uncharacterized protein n=1 Tax=Raineya orbicola TaxID=2016530 RepID=A0A2N3IDG3_9BACT|nr:hypothetical protein [Raineya orbicola]MCS6794893.1 hypothetical protein [Raineya sp.]MCX7929010.1 hypothetical protein [Patescibacteria group bacterium]MDW8295703.1 hypothetical protein [Raineya sp.]PKQ68340.1 hypothetical protein Rain11_1704 [Raineya orbicola]